jgi:hypothetical protein
MDDGDSLNYQRDVVLWQWANLIYEFVKEELMKEMDRQAPVRPRRLAIFPGSQPNAKVPKVTQAHMADAIGVDQPTVSRMKNGHITALTVAAISIRFPSAPIPLPPSLAEATEPYLIHHCSRHREKATDESARLTAVECQAILRLNEAGYFTDSRERQKSALQTVMAASGFTEAWVLKVVAKWLPSFMAVIAGEVDQDGEDEEPVIPVVHPRRRAR